MNNEEKILQMLGEIQQKLGEHDKRFEKMDQRMGNLDARMGNLEAGQEQLKTEVRQTRVLVEQQDHKISLIAEQYTDIAEKLDKANERAAQIDDMKDRLRTLETVVMNHTALLKRLDKAQ